MRVKFILVSLLFVFASAGFCSIKEMSQEQWKNVLEGAGIKADAGLVEKLIRSADTLDQINMQTRGALSPAEWKSVFDKLHIEYGKDFEPREWESLLQKIGIQFKASVQTQDIVVSSPSAQVPAQINIQEPLPAQQAAEPQAQVQHENTKYPPVSFDLRGMDILSVLKMISQKTNLNIIAGNNVRGSVTIYLKDVDALDALKMILEMNDLAYVYEDKVIKVLTAQDYERIYGRKFYDRTVVEIINLAFGKADNVLKTITSVKSRIGQIIADSASNSLIVIDTPDNINELKKIIETLDVKVDTKVFPLNYTKAKEISDKIKTTLSPNIGNIEIDERSNQLIVTDAVKRMDDISRLITLLDKRHREVLIEARIVQLIHDNDVKMGVSWDSVFNKISDQLMPGKLIGNLSNLARPQSIGVGGENGIQLSVGTLEINNFNAVFDMLQTVGKTDLVATPRIAAIENKEARILVGTKEAYVTTQVTNQGSAASSPIVAESVNFVDVGMKLFVTPSVGEDGFITMKIRPEVSSVDRILRTSQNNPIPIVRTSESETTIMVKDGITIVIAGLMEEKEIKKLEGIPLICRIPIIGIPFRRTSSEKVKTELIVFLTPHIMTGDVSTDEVKKK